MLMEYHEHGTLADGWRHARAVVAPELARLWLSGRGDEAMKTRSLDSDCWLPAGIDEVFAFFSDARNLERLTPPWLGFHIVTPMPIVLGVGAVIDYRLKIHKIPVRWRSEITAWEPPQRFVDAQRKGPYKKWIHTHTFAPEAGGTRVRDHVEFAIPGSICEPLLYRFMVGPDLREIFEYRRGVLEDMFQLIENKINDRRPDGKIHPKGES